MPPRGLDDLADVAHDQRAAGHHAEVDGLEVGELRVVALDRHHGLPRGDLVALVQRLDLELLEAVDPEVALVVAGALLEHGDRLVDPAEDRLLALEDLHQHPRVVIVGLQQLLGQVEVRVRVVALADLLHRQAEDGRRHADALTDGHCPDRLRDGAAGRERDHQRAQRDAVDHEHDRRVRDQVAQQPGDRRVPDDEGDAASRGSSAPRPRRPGRRSCAARTGRRAPRPGSRAGTSSARRTRGRSRRTGRRVIVEPERDTPGTSAQRLREADHRRVAGVDGRQIAVARADLLGDQQHEAEHDQRRADQVEVARAALDLVAEDAARRWRSGSCRGRCTSPSARRGRRAAPACRGS